jgi:hypothetical protein
MRRAMQLLIVLVTAAMFFHFGMTVGSLGAFLIFAMLVYAISESSA